MKQQDSFYAMIPGAMGWVHFKWKNKQKQLSQKEEEEFIDNYTRDAMNVLMTKDTYSYENVKHPYVAHFQARQDARRILDSTGPSIEIRKTDLQVGNKECLDYIYKMQKNKDFVEWINPQIIKLYIQVTKELIESSND